MVQGSKIRTATDVGDEAVSVVGALGEAASVEIEGELLSAVVVMPASLSVVCVPGGGWAAVWSGGGWVPVWSGGATEPVVRSLLGAAMTESFPPPELDGGGGSDGDGGGGAWPDGRTT